MTAAETEPSSARVQELEALLGRMQSELAATSARLAAITPERDNLRRAYRQLMEQFELLRRYLGARHPGGGMAEMAWPDYVAMVEDTAVRTHIVEYRDRGEDNGPGALIACVLIDALADGLSMVYSFYDPAMDRRSLGSFMILDHVRQARETGTPYVYLGYWVGGSAKMAYKAKFDPIELLRPSGWLLMSDEERAAAARA